MQTQCCMGLGNHYLCLGKQKTHGYDFIFNKRGVDYIKQRGSVGDGVRALGVGRWEMGLHSFLYPLPCNAVRKITCQELIHSTHLSSWITQLSLTALRSMGIYTLNIWTAVCLKSQKILGYTVMNLHKSPEEMLYDVHKEETMFVDFSPKTKVLGHLRHIHKYKKIN